jgi:hypothetical protein
MTGAHARRPKGLPKTGGKKKGSVNKTTVDFGCRLSELNVDLLEEIILLIKDQSTDAPSKAQKLSALCQMLSYIYPTKKAISLTPQEEDLLKQLKALTEMADKELNQMIENYIKHAKSNTAVLSNSISIASEAKLEEITV